MELDKDPLTVDYQRSDLTMGAMIVLQYLIYCPQTFFQWNFFLYITPSLFFWLAFQLLFALENLGRVEVFLTFFFLLVSIGTVGPR